jgi:Transglycosylase SLT domain
MTAQVMNPNPMQRGRVGPLSDRILKGVYALTHRGLALLGLTLALVASVALMRPDVREEAEHKLLGWLLERQSADVTLLSEPADRVTAADPSDLPREQARLAEWISKKYRVAAEPVGALVAEAYAQGRRIQIDPTLILAVMAVESGFNPYAQSAMGAQGLMQVLTRIHTHRYEDFGGRLAAFDPISNLRVGVQVLKDCIRIQGSVEGGLRMYLGGGADGGAGYTSKVLGLQQRMRSAANGLAEPAVAKTSPRASGSAAPARVAPQGSDELEAEVLHPEVLPARHS